MKVTYDQETDALYIEFHPLNNGKARCQELTEDITVDYGSDGRLAGIEVLDASQILGEEMNRVVLEITPVLKANTA